MGICRITQIGGTRATGNAETVYPTATATITFPGQQLSSATDWFTDKPVKVNKRKVNKPQNSLSLTLATGAVSIVELK